MRTSLKSNSLPGRTCPSNSTNGTTPYINLQNYTGTNRLYRNRKQEKNLRERSAPQINLTPLLRTLKLQHFQEHLSHAKRVRGGLHRLHQSLGEQCDSSTYRSRRGRCAHSLSPIRDHCQHRHVRHCGHINGRSPQISHNSNGINGTAHQNYDNVFRKILSRRTNGKQ